MLTLLAMTFAPRSDLGDHTTPPLEAHLLVEVQHVIEQASGDWTGGLLGDVAFGVKRVFYHRLQSGTI